MMSALVSFWLDPEAIYLSPAPLYHTAPSVWSMTIQAGGITTVVMDKFDAEGCLDAIQRTASPTASSCRSCSPAC